MRAWKDRPIEIQNLLNPAFCGEVLRRSIIKYKTETNRSFPFELSFLVLPLILNKEIRTLIPTRGAKYFHSWVENNPKVKFGLSESIKRFSPYTKEAILFLSQQEHVKFEVDGSISILNSRRKSILNYEIETHPDNFYKKSEKLGQWFAKSLNTDHVFSTLGVSL